MRPSQNPPIRPPNPAPPIRIGKRHGPEEFDAFPKRRKTPEGAPAPGGDTAAPQPPASGSRDRPR